MNSLVCIDFFQGQLDLCKETEIAPFVIGASFGDMKFRDGFHKGFPLSESSGYSEPESDGSDFSDFLPQKRKRN